MSRADFDRRDRDSEGAGDGLEGPRGLNPMGRNSRTLVAALVGSLFASCAGAQEAPSRVEVRAPIVRVAVRVAESFPPQYFADVTSALPDGCTEFARFAVRREASTVFVDVFNTRPAGSEVACTMIYGEKQTAVPLGSDFAPGAAHTLDVNGTREAFVAQ